MRKTRLLTSIISGQASFCPLERNVLKTNNVEKCEATYAANRQWGLFGLFAKDRSLFCTFLNAASLAPRNQHPPGQWPRLPSRPIPPVVARHAAAPLSSGTHEQRYPRLVARRSQAHACQKEKSAKGCCFLRRCPRG